jgi:regulator of protease activity HflC (stomatin/prohibitin superfamily)
MGSIKELLEYLLNAVKIWIIIQPWQTGIIVRNGNKTRKVTKGIYFRIPYFDNVFVQENRLRVGCLPVQTLTSKDLQTLTLNSSVGYSVSCIEKLYDSLYHPETTIRNMAMSEIASFVFNNDLKGINPTLIEKVVLEKLNALDYGLKFEYFKITNFAVVKTYRLIQDQSWSGESLNMNDKK